MTAACQNIAKYRIFMNLTNVKAKRTYSNRKATYKELTLRLNMTRFNLHSHNCKHNYKRVMQTAAFASGPDESRTIKGKFYCLNNIPKAEQAMFPTTGHWKFVPLPQRDRSQIRTLQICSEYRINIYAKRSAFL
eukprot:10721249-Ditylum_brightwellii.AAC.1